MYASQSGGAIPGSAHTSARFTYTNPENPTPTLAGAYSDSNNPNVVSVFDWASPIMKVMGVKFDEGESTAARIGVGATPNPNARWQRIKNFPGFKCPENGVLATSFGSVSDPTAGTVLSYNTALCFLVAHNDGSSNPSPVTCGWSDSFKAWNPPPGYVPKLGKVGGSSRKIFIGDGARYSNVTDGPDYDLSFNGSLGGAFSDQGAWTPFSNSWFRKSAPGNGLGPAFGRDARLFAYRHGINKQWLKGDLYKGNFGFFDGHVELLGDLESSRPEFWMPKGTLAFSSNAQTYADTRTAFGLPVNATFIVP